MFSRPLHVRAETGSWYRLLITSSSADNFVIYSIYRENRKVIASLAWIVKKLLLIIGMQGSSHTDEVIVTGVAIGFCPTNPGIMINTILQCLKREICIEPLRLF